MDAGLSETGVRDELARHRAAVIGVPMTYGTDDCVLFVAGVVRALGGPDLLAHVEPWSGHNEALARVDEHRGFVRAVIGAARRARMTRVAPDRAQAGDIGIVHHGDVWTCAVVGLHGWAYARAPRGVAAIPASQIKAVWTWRA